MRVSARVAACRPPVPLLLYAHAPCLYMAGPSLKAETPGPGAYTPVEQNAGLSTKPRVVASSFGVEPRTSKGLMDSAACFHGKVTTRGPSRVWLARVGWGGCLSLSSLCRAVWMTAGRSLAGPRGHDAREHLRPLAGSRIQSVTPAGAHPERAGGDRHLEAFWPRPNDREMKTRGMLAALRYLCVLRGQSWSAGHV